MHSLPIFVRLTGRPVILIGAGEAAEAKRRLLERAGARIVGEEDEAQLAIVAIDDDGEAEAAVVRLKARGVLVNATDRPALCDFTLPAIIERDPVLIAIGTGGASAGLAKALRQRLEVLLPAGLGQLAQALHGARDAIRARWPASADRRRAIDAALLPGGALDPLAGEQDVAGWLGGSCRGQGAKLVAIRLRSADPDDLTLREARLLGSADRIYHRADVPPAILDRARADAVQIVCDVAPNILDDGLSLDLG
jgi:uroporphyrin-III C-methyltransferase/precorrin-2 dehydrogenase/sirohydrochlorin ferrochelatase